jgi:hypothetical protein
VSFPGVKLIQFDDTRESGDVFTPSWDVLGRLEASHSSPKLAPPLGMAMSTLRRRGPVNFFILGVITAKQTTPAGTFQRRFGTF